MGAENRLHFFRMCAWGMFDPDTLPRNERSVRLKQIRMVVRDCGFDLHISGSAKKTEYVLLKGDVRQWTARDADGRLVRLNTLQGICRALLPIAETKLTPNSAR
jgi:hypothetical protein